MGNRRWELMGSAGVILPFHQKMSAVSAKRRVPACALAEFRSSYGATPDDESRS